MTEFRIVRTIGDIQYLEPGAIFVDHHRVWTAGAYLAQAGRVRRDQRVSPMAVVVPGATRRKAVRAIKQEITQELDNVRREYGGS